MELFAIERQHTNIDVFRPMLHKLLELCGACRLPSSRYRAFADTVTVAFWIKLVLKGSAKNTWWKPFTSIAYGGGVRVGELINLTCVYIDFERWNIHVAPKRKTDETLAWESKDREKRVVPMSDAIHRN